MRLVWGDLDLTDSPYLVEFGFDPGAPQNEATALASLLQDGEIELSSRASNRTLQFNVLIEASDLAEAADAEFALLSESEKVLNTISVDPEDFGPVAVYEVFRGQLTLVRDDEFERSKMRRYTVTVRAYPFVRSAAKFTSVGVTPGGSTTTTLDTCGATTGWTGFADGVSATVTNNVGPPTTNSLALASGPGGGHQLELRKTFAATTSTTNLLMVDWLATPSVSGFDALADGVELVKFAEGASPTPGYTRTWFKVGATTMAATRLTATFPPSSSTVSRTLNIDNVAVTNVAPISGTNRQQLRAVDVPGSARTPGSLAIESATAALGDDTMVYVYPPDLATDGYSPPLRQYRSAGNTVTPDTSQVSGSTEPLTGSGVTFRISAGQLPIGTYVLMGRMATSGGGTPTVSYTVKTLFDGGIVPVAFSGSRAIATTTAYQTFVVGRMILPATDLSPNASAAGVVTSLNIVASSTCTYDEFWLFNMTTGQLTWVDCGTGSGAPGRASRRLFLEPASVDTPRPTVRVGHSADRSDSFYPTAALKSWQSPLFTPDRVNVLAVTPNATDAVISLSGYAHWHTNAAS